MCCAFFAGASAASAATDFSDYSVFASASSTTVSTIKIGATTDSETAITSNSTATGDDTTGSDDEDGVTVPGSVALGASSSMTVNVTNTSGSTVYLNVWIDFNRNGVLTDSGEQVATNTTIATGTSGVNKTVNFTVPATASVGTAGVRVRLTSTSTPGSTGLVGNGEVEDYVMTLACPTLSLSPGATAIPDAYVGTAFSQTISASGGTGSYTYAVTSGSMPSGLSLSTSGVISGTPTGSNGSGSSVTIRATDSTGCQVSLAYNVQVCPTISLSPTTVAGSTVGVAYSQTITASGGSSAYTYAISTGSLPSGLSLNTSTGVISGTATSTTPATTRNYSLTPVCPAISIAPTSLAQGIIGSAYSQTTAFSASGGTAPYTFSATGLPAGMDFDATNKVITGTPLFSDTYSITITATDAYGCSKNQTVSFTTSPLITITPTTMPNGTSGTAYSQTMTAKEAGFDIQQAFSSTSIATLANADAVLAGTNRTSNWTGAAATVSFNSSGAGGGHFTDSDFPGGPGDNFALKASGIITIPTAGAWTFATASDDGVRVRIDGVNVINDDTQHATTDKFGTVTLTAGTHSIELVFFELGGGEAVELFAASGTLSAFSTSFKLVGGSGGLSVVRSSPTYTWSIASGTLPGGLTLNTSTGVISGTPTGTGGTASFVLQALDADGGYGTQSLSITTACPTITISPTSLSNGSVGAAYSQTVSATGGVSSYTYAVSSGSLPSGLSLNTSTGVISGTPTSGTAATFTIRATDANACLATRSYTVTPATSADYGDYSGFGSVSSTMNATLKIGATIDVEASATTNATATGDDITGSDDEDGVTVPASLMLGSAGTITVNVSNTSGATAYLNAWIDYNRNGVLTDSGEQIATNTVIATGTSNSNKTISFTVPSGASIGTTGVRVRLTSTSSPGSTGASGNGEVEDYTVVIAPSLGIGNMIWNDSDENGLFDPGESGIDGVLVELWSTGVDNAIGGTGTSADTKVTSMTSSGGGLYNFSGLTSGYYYVKVPTPPLSRTSIVVDSTDNGQDGDNNASQPGGSGTAAYSPVIQLVPGTEPGSTGTGNIDNTVDFGFAANIGSPFVCDNRFYIIQNVEGTPGAGDWDTTLYYIDTNQTLVPIFVFDGKKLNGLVAYGGYLYCVDQNGGNLYRINSLGVLVDMGLIAGIPNSPTDGQWGGGTALTSGLMIINRYTFSNAQTALYTIDLNSATVVGSPVITKYASTGANTTGNFGDIVWDPLTSKIYGYNTNDTTNLGLHEINTTTGMCTRIGSAVLSTFGSLTIDANGLAYGYGSSNLSNAQDTLYVFNRTSGVLNGSVTIVGSGPTVTNSDGAACPGAPPSMKLGSLVWNDVNNNGIKDTGEAGIDGVTLQLFLGGQNPVTATPAATVTTAGGGLYSFSNLSPGQYFIYIPTPPASFPLSSTTTVSSDNDVDNDDNGIQTSQGLPVQSPLIGLAGGTESITDGDTDSNTNLSIDFGFLGCASVTVAPTTPAAMTFGTAYTQTFTASGGISPYTWAVSSGTLPAGLSLNTSTGVVSGTPTSGAAASFTLRATDAGGCTGTRSYTVTPTCTTVSVTTSTLPDAFLGTAYSQTLAASGGTTPYTWTVSSGTLPTGLSLSSSGVISGTATTANGAGVSVTFAVTDAKSCAATKPLVLQTCPVVTISPTTLPDAAIGTAYSQTLNATGGTASYTWAVSSGTLPAGLTLNASTGVISGTPTTANGAGVSLTFRATDANGCQGTLTATLQVCPVLSMSPATLTTAIQGSAYSQSLTTTGGTAAYTYSLSSGTLPAGLTLSSAGVISGTPTASNGADANLTFLVTDANGCQASFVRTLKSCPVITLAPSTLAVSSVGTAYSQTITASGGSAAFSFTVTSGTLPAGLTLNASTGLISGTPTTSNAAGTSITITATNSFGCASSRTYSLQVCPSMILSPATLSVPTAGTAYSQTITASGSATACTFTLSSGTLPAGLSLSSTGVISGTPTSTASTTFTIRAMDANGCSTTSAYTLAPACAAIAITPTTLNPGRQGTAYSAALSATPTASYTWTVASGTLPTGLTLNASTGALGGTPSAAGAYSFTVKAGTGPATVPQLTFSTYNLDLNPGDTFNIRDYVLPKDGSNSPIDWSQVQFTYTGAGANDPTSPADWNLTSFNAGLPVTTTNADATAGGNSGTGQFRIYIVRNGQTTYDDHMEIRVDASSTSLVNSAKVSPPIPSACSATRAYSMRICPVITLTPSTPASSTVGTAYSQTVTASNGTTPYVFAVSTGTLPAGLSLNTSSGVISGTPTTPTTANFTISATDANGCAGSISYTITPAPNTDFGDFSGFASTSNTSNGTLKIGSLIDMEVTGTSNASATGDDTTGSDDEDGATLPGSITAGSTVTIPVVVTNSGSTTAYLNAWIDFNNNGVLTDSGEQIAVDTPVTAGTSAATVNVTFTVPVGASVGASRGVRVRLTGAATPGSTGTGGVGETEDYIVTIGAPTIDYGDYSSFGPAGSTLNSTLKIGALTDVEGQSTMSATATGDDTTGSDDEDGVTVPATITQNVASSMTVNVSNTSGASAYLNAWIDYNGNGVLTDSGEQIATNTVIATGTSNSNKTISFTVPAAVKTGTTGVRVRLTSVSSPGPTGTIGTGEVEDYTTTIVATSDFGDYASFGSASSKSNNTLKLGLLVDAEGSNMPDSTATGDDLDGTDDEDGVTVPLNIAQGAAGSLTARVTNTSGSASYLNAWIDFNRNGLLTDSGEQIAVNTAITTGTSNGTQVINFTAPVGASLGTAGVRVRLTSTSSPGSTGLSGNGEVEDYVTTIVVPTTDFGDYSGFADAFSTVNSSLMLGALVDAEGSATKNTAATGDDTTGSDDEDSVVFPSMTAGQPGSVSVILTNTSGAPAYLNAWIDFNNNGSLLDAGEQIASDILIADGTDGDSQVVNFTVPTNAVTAATSLGTRLRLTSVASPGPTGGAGNGEVEDHTIVILAPLTDFGDFSGAPDVSNTASTNVRLGTLVDTEYSSTRNATATGDDVIGSDDEDGVTLPSLMAGAPATIPVVVTNTSGSVGYLNAWIDYNNNGVFTDAGEQIASNVSIVTGTSNATQNLNITVPAAAQTGTNVGARFRISTDISPGSTGAGGVGEVEDYVVNIAPATTDFGDFASFGSASSVQNSTIKLGLLTDTEYVQTTNATATGDDITALDDEDAVTFPALTAGAPVTLPVLATNTSGATVYLNAWIDYNNNGVLTDSGEQIATNLAVSTGTSNVAQNLNINIPATALTGVNLGARFRLTSTSGALSTGAAGNGEVEDYIVNISAPTTDFGDFSGFADASQGANPALHIGALIDTEFASTRNATATGDDTTGTDDEDGVTVPSMIAGQTVTIPVTITNTTGAIGYLNAWIDFNNNGVLTDSGEQIATNLNIATGTNNGVTNLTVAVPANAVTGTNVGLRFRLSAPSGLGPTGANGLAGEVEDYVVNIAAPTTDFGDFSGFGSASSTQISTMKIGALTDTEYAQTTNTTATGDDITGTDDEDGVTLPSMTAGGPAVIPVTVTNTSGATAFINAWIDYNNNGVLTDAGEQIASNTVVANGTSNAVQNLNITVPATATVGTNLGVRVRLTSTSTPGSTGQSGNGEVEDYLVNIASPTTDFGDFSGFSSASNAAGTGLRLGALVDAEYTGTSNATATGDDITGQADEDGVVLPAMTAGQTLTIPVVVTNTTGSAAFLNAWIDFNNNGVPTDSGEQIITNLSVATGSNGVTMNPSITVPASAVTGTALGVRFRLTAVSSPGASGALASLGEVEDYTVTIALPTTDFGDNSALANASSTANSNLKLGLLTDVEYVATTNLTATGDDITGQADEDGLTLPTLTAGAPATLPVVVTNNTGAAAFLNVWIDYNNNSILTDAGEQVATNVSIPTGTANATQNLSITVPATALTGTNLAVRVRLTSVSSPGSTGAAGLGEVEDYLVNIARPQLDYGDWSGLADAASTANGTLRLGALVDTEYVSTRNVGATGDDITGTDDEDGVTLPSFTAGAPATIPVVVTNTSGANAYLNIWIDYNNNGVLTDAGEQIATNVVIANGVNGGTQNINITVPANAVTGSNLGLRVRLTDVASPGVTGTAGNGEVEDYVTPIAVPTTDFGDWNGAADASSIASSNLRMGALADTEYLSTLNGTATGDDITGSDDEDGVTLGSQTPGTAGSASVVVTNNSGAAGYLNAWIDFNNNGSFADAGEQIATNTSIATGTNGVTQTVNFVVPVGAVPGQRGARFRLTSTQNPTSIGASGTGEVEDYLVTITCLPIAVTPSTIATPTVGTAYSQTVTSSGGLAPYTFSVGSGALPAGLTLSSAGVISGTPTSSSSATFSILATDSYGCTGSTSYTITPVCPTVTVNPTTLPSGLVGTAYSQTLTASGGTAGYTFAVSSGTLPAGLTLNAGTGVLSGTPTTSNASGVLLTFRATDANGCSGTRTINLIICPVITLAPATLPTPIVGTAYSQSITASGSSAAYTYTLAGGALPTWATLSSAGVLSGTPTTTTSATFTVKATDANGCTGTLSYTVAPVCPTITITQSALAQGTVGTAYSQTLTASGGTAPYSAWTLTSGTLPAGLSLNASSGVISGTPTAVVSPATTITVRVNDANGCQGSRSIILQICPVVTLSPATLPAPVVGTAYSQSLSAANGTVPYTFTLASGTLPAWATLSSAGVLSGTPTTTTAATFAVKATDANGCAGTQSYTVTPGCPAISLAPAVPAQSIVGALYSQTLTPSGGTAPYSGFTVTSGTLPAGLTLNASTGVISGTPTATNGAGVSVSIRVTDTYGCQGTQAFTLQVCPVITLAPTTPATPTVSTAYSQTFTASGSTGSYTFSVAGGALPTWATLSTSGTLSGMPDSPNSATFTIKATDANGCSGTQSYTITPACPTMSITPTTAAAGTVGSLYSQTLSGNGGTAPYGSWVVTSGTLPSGLSLSLAGVISGTPTASNGAGVSFTVRTTDARGCSVSGVISLKICPVVSVSPTTLAAATAGSSYSQTISASGGATPYVYALASGSLPTGLTINSSTGVISGTPTTTTAANFTISATDANGCSGSRSYSLTPACQTITVGPATLINGTVNSAYSQTVTSTSGIGTVTFAVSSGTLPAGLSLNASTGVISGTPTSTLAATFTVRATDSNGCTGSTSYTVTPACPTVTVGPATLTTGNVGVAYTQTLAGAGGIAPYSAWTVTSGALPAGLSLNPSSGVISGTPTTANGTGVSVTIRTTDANGCTGSSVVSIKICPVITQTPATLATPTVGTAYTQVITAAGGVSPYTFTLTSGSLPTGMTLSSSGTISGTTPSSTSATFTVKATAADGCAGTASYTLTPVCPTLAISPNGTLPPAYLGAPYTQTLTASGGTSAYTFALLSGDLPGGVLLASNGVLSGTPNAKGVFPVTIRVTDANACAQSFNVTLQVHTLSIGNLVFEDSNNNGVKDTSEPGVASATVQLFTPGDDNAIGGSGTAADTQVGSSLTTDGTGAYLFNSLPAGKYYIKVTPPSDYLFTGGTADTSDDNIDNNNDGAQPGGSGKPLFSPIVTLSGGAESITDGDSDPDTNLTVDFGLWSSVGVGNMIFLDINGDGHRNEGESLGNIYVELYAQGATPGVDDPVSAGTSGCSCKGRYFLDGLNPGTYFLYIPPSQFSSGAPLEGLLPMSNVVAGDDDAGQDLIYNSNPAVNGASTSLFTLRPGFCPTGTAESGAEGSIDDSMDARVDLTRDLGIVAPAGTGFAASEAIRRYIVTGGFTASVLPGATTFALWSQDSNIGKATDDPDEDGLANLMEYALGTDPGNPLQANRFTLTHDAATGSLTALLTVPSGTHDDLSISLETLTDLSQAGNASAWKKLSMAATTTINADGTLTRAYASLEKLLVFKGLDTGFVRLHVDLDANRDGVPEATVTSAIQGWGRQSFATGSRTFSMPLLNAAFFTGRAVSASSNEIMLPAILTLPAGSLYLEALDGTLAGQRFDIDSAASSGNTVVLQNTSQSYAGLANARIAIRLHHTLAELLPPAAFSSDDRVLFFDPAASNFTTLTQDTDTWLSGVLSMSARPVAAHEAALVQVRGNGTTLMFTGEVRVTSFVTPLVSGTQLVAPGWPVISPAPVTGLSSGLTAETADRFRLWDGDTTAGASSYTGYYLDGSTTPPAWVPQTTPAPAATLQPFHGYFLIRTAPLQLQQSAPW
ncbi:putative Ig domain-containing protein [Prosthecobacter sp.]|uniref:putative Ig domain-containing protein n=1 Tax=Prosthecobacter sp. TaxID=1965333 RepID=UPI003784A84A